MKRNALITTTILILLLGVAGFWLVSNSRAATETPEYKIVRTDGKFEIRDYPALEFAGTSMEGSDMDGSFMRLFRFITGKNEGAREIAMTAPVLINSTAANRTMSFIMPKRAVEQGVPKPSDEKVSLGKIEPARFAVFRFDGNRTAENEEKAASKLKAWLEAEKLTAKGAPMFAYYDPPWTPIFLRRNEVFIRIGQSAN